MKTLAKPVVFYVKESAATCCTASTVHRSGNWALQIGHGDPLWDEKVTEVVGVIESVEQPIRVTPDTWVYRITYQPVKGKHGFMMPIGYMGPLELGKTTGQDSGDPARPLAVSA